MLSHPETDEEVTTLTVVTLNVVLNVALPTIKHLKAVIKSKCSVSFADSMAAKTQIVGTRKMANVPQVI